MAPSETMTRMKRNVLLLAVLMSNVLNDSVTACSLKYLEGTWVAYTSGNQYGSHYLAIAEVLSASANNPEMLRLKCEKTIKPGHTNPMARCGWVYANCSMPIAGTLDCHFFNNGSTFERVAEVSTSCNELSHWTDSFAKEWVREYHHPSCASYIVNETCKANPAQNYSGCPGGCGDPANCVQCAIRFDKSGRGDSEAPYICSGGMSEIREVCGATKGRLQSPVIQTKAGQVQGFIDIDSSHYVFRGIPYAKPPLDDLRWRPPQSPTPWQNVLNASEFGHTCKQNGPAWKSMTLDAIRNSSEDCLYLNVYVPAKYIAARANPGPKPPTLIYFPAGQYLWGSANDAENFNAPQTAAGREMIVVTANYRLGALGFLALDELRSRDENNSTGNYGSLDQRHALIWIKENIAAFGGDSDNVVLWGESAGAAAVTAHLAMKGSWPYFSKAIMESGAFNGWSFRTFKDTNANSMQVVNNLNCSMMVSNGTHKIKRANVTCLLGKTVDDVNSYDDDAAGLADGPEFGMPYGDRLDRSSWAPAIDGVILTGAPEDLIKTDSIAPVPLLFGTNRDEGSTFTYNQTGVGDSNGGLGPNRKSMYDGFLFDIGILLDHSFTPPDVQKLIDSQNFTTGLFVNESEFDVWASNMFGESVGTKLKTVYFPYNATTNQVPDVFNPEGIANWWWAMSRAIGDFVLSCPARKAAKFINEFNHEAAYVFHFNHTPSFSINQEDTYLYGAFHGSEVPFVFYDEFELVTPEERTLSQAMVQYWAGFAWNGNPNVPPPNLTGGLENLPEFPAYDSQNDTYLILGDGQAAGTRYPNITTLSGLKLHECNFWDSI